jgi:hypothetical protein
MTNEDKQLLIKDLCARLPYYPHPKIHIFTEGEYAPSTRIQNLVRIEMWKVRNGECQWLINDYPLEDIKPYLRPISSMTEEEWIKFYKWANCRIEKDSGEIGSKSRGFGDGYEYLGIDDMSDAIDFLNAHHFDYLGLIEKGLALEAPADMY